MRTPPAYHLSRRSLGEDGTTLVTSNHCIPIAFIPHFFGTHVDFGGLTCNVVAAGGFLV